MCKKEEKENMGTTIKPIKSMEINFKSEKDYEEFVDFINNPPEPSEYVKNLIKQKQKLARDD